VQCAGAMREGPKLQQSPEVWQGKEWCVGTMRVQFQTVRYTPGTNVGMVYAGTKRKKTEHELKTSCKVSQDLREAGEPQHARATICFMAFRREAVHAPRAQRTPPRVGACAVGYVV